MNAERRLALLVQIETTRLDYLGLAHYIVELHHAAATLDISKDEVDELLAGILRERPGLLAERPNAIGPLVSLLDESGEVRPLGAIEVEVMKFAIQKYQGQMSETARRLGIGRSTLYRKLDAELARQPMHITS